MNKETVVHCNQLVFNKKYAEIEEEYERMGISVPEDLEFEKFDKLPISFDIEQLYMFGVDSDFQDYTIIIISDIAYLIDVNYLVLKNKIDLLDA